MYQTVFKLIKKFQALQFFYKSIVHLFVWFVNNVWDFSVICFALYL